MTPSKHPEPRLESESAFLSERLSQDRPPRLAVRMVLDLAQAPGQIVQKLSEAAAGVGDQMWIAFKQHVANLADESHAIATKLTFAEIGKMPPTMQAELIHEGKGATIVSEAAVRQRRMAPEVQAALIEHCKDHTASMQMLAARPDATLGTLAALAESSDQRTRLNVAANIGPRMRISEQILTSEKAAIFDALIANYESDYAPYLVPVCRSSDQLGMMFDRTSKAFGMVEAFVENPYTPDRVLIEIASSPTLRLVQHDIAKDAKEALQVRADLRESVVRESSSPYDDMAPS